MVSLLWMESLLWMVSLLCMVSLFVLRGFAADVFVITCSLALDEFSLLWIVSLLLLFSFVRGWCLCVGGVFLLRLLL